MLREIVHYGIHFILPIIAGILFYPGKRLKATLILLSGIIIDLDHLLANPVFDPNRCSIGFHPLHAPWAIVLYATLLIPKSTRIFGLALMIHILADASDCWLLFKGF
ncbi:DUF6122 family protein [Robiginitalea aurantiaca]|uniref:DUF6122 family protein n=1 Tax=Robiginitalea aurantiaca TaxID=3056915 RepID=A0ABT7WGL4_9FLAO|nr:DUF6122 family protein [Robiginitalea aurantiaca]MDM9632065.1 DUF6122 family protein [Robiginitalea aurantiaca]